MIKKIETNMKIAINDFNHTDTEEKIKYTNSSSEATSTWQLFLTNFDRHITTFFSNYIDAKTDPKNIDSSTKRKINKDKGIDVHIAYTLAEINQMESQHAQINALTELYDYLVDNFDREFVDVISITESYKTIIGESIKLYFTIRPHHNKHFNSYLQNVIERCINIYSSRTLYELIIMFIGEHDDIYSKFCASIKMSIGEYIMNYKNNGEQQMIKEKVISFYDADKLCKKIISATEDELQHPSQNNEFVEEFGDKMTSQNEEQKCFFDVIKKINESGCVNKEDKDDSYFVTINKLKTNIQSMTKDINENIDMGQLDETIDIIIKNRDMFPRDSSDDSAGAMTILKFKLYYHYNDVLSKHNQDDKIEEKMEKYYDILFGKNIDIDNDMVKYFSKNKNKFSGDRLKYIEQGIMKILFNK